MSTSAEPITKPDAETVYEVYRATGSVHRAAERLGVCGETVRAWLKGAGFRLKGSDWTEEELQILRVYYTATPRDDFNCAHLARRLGRSVDSVQIKAGRLGLADRSHMGGKRRPKAKQLELPWRRWVKHEHPRGMLGKRKKPESTARSIAGLKKKWDEHRANGTGWFTPENIQLRSDRMHIRSTTDPRVQHGYSRCRGGRRADLGNRYFRSAWEANIARYLNFLQSHGQIAKWDYECENFEFAGIKRGTRSYTPDFKIWDTPDGDPYFWEVKGWMDPKSTTRLKRMKKYHPGVRVEVIDQKRYQGIAASASALIPTWEKGTLR